MVLDAKMIALLQIQVIPVPEVPQLLLMYAH